MVVLFQLTSATDRFSPMYGNCGLIVFKGLWLDCCFSKCTQKRGLTRLCFGSRWSPFGRLRKETTV